jgi:uncharacterized protein
LDYGETIESFTNKLFDLWFPTPEASANQTVLVLDNLTNNVALRAGETVKTKLSDDVAQSVTQETVLIPLKEGNKYNQALLGASDRLAAVLSGRPDPGPPTLTDNVQVEGTFATPEETKESNATVWGHRLPRRGNRCTNGNLLFLPLPTITGRIVFSCQLLEKLGC